ncbi:NAD(P)/FAD-dependent oxidoreductase [Paenibacillus taiwanensis]|uniref:NAD(P)/FAD-dependent oxidoreductase n=1 Tax=Paenibacillus taiwanensis TaxID=401638 RepID=UPI0004280461|nr:FAD-dependent oxidoreductase [Paenibacillus taiwanensis]
MTPFTCIVVGGGYAGIHALQALRQSLGEQVKGREVRFILMDKQPHHLRKVLLFKPAAADMNITLPLKELFSEGVEVIQGTVSALEPTHRKLHYTDEDGATQSIGYDVIVLALGSVIREAAPAQGGITLSSIHAAATIRKLWLANLQQAVREPNAALRQRLLTLAVAGAGISGIETAAELAHAIRAAAVGLGLNPADVKVYLLNAQDTLLPNGPAKMARKLERSLADCGVTVLHRKKALHEQDGQLTLADGDVIPVGVCVWTLGLLPNPIVRSLGLPVTPEGQLVVDASYRVKGCSCIYSIGDCARIVDPASGQVDQMTCKEGNAQAARLGKIVFADLQGTAAPSHKSFMDFFCVGLGPNRGVVWTRYRGLDIILTGKIGWKIRQLTWNMASLIKS